MGIKKALEKFKNTVGDIFIPFGNYEYKEGMEDNNISFLNYLIQFIEIAICRFEYENLPEEIDVLDLERFLFQDGKVIFFQDEYTNKFVALPCSGNGGVKDKYGHPVSVSVKGNGDNNYHVDGITEFVEIKILRFLSLLLFVCLIMRNIYTTLIVLSISMLQLKRHHCY